MGFYMFVGKPIHPSVHTRHPIGFQKGLLSPIHSGTGRVLTPVPSSLDHMPTINQHMHMRRLPAIQNYKPPVSPPLAGIQDREGSATTYSFYALITYIYLYIYGIHLSQPATQIPRSSTHPLSAQTLPILSRSLVTPLRRRRRQTRPVFWVVYYVAPGGYDNFATEAPRYFLTFLVIRLV